MQQTTPHRHVKRSHFTAAGVLLAALALAAPALALTVDSKGYVEIRGVADHNVSDGSDRRSADNDRTAVEQRLRLWTEAAADENVKAVFAIEIDNAWGQTGTAALQSSDGSKKEVGSVGSDAKGQIEIKHAYLDFNLPALKTNIKAGAQGFKLGGGYIANDDASGIQTTTRLSENTSLKLVWVKAIEGNVAVTSDDIDFYATQLDVKTGPVTVSPLFAWTRNAKNIDIYFGGFDLAGKFGDKTRLAATLVKNWGDRLGGEKIDGTAAYLGLFQSVGTGGELSLEGAWIGDNGRTGGEFIDGSGSIGTWGTSNATELLGGGRFNRTAVIGQGLGTASASGQGDLYNLNQAYLKLGFGVKTSDATKLSGYLAHIQAADGGKNDTLDTAFGEEIGAYYDITLAKGLIYTLGGAYLFNDDFANNGGVGNDDVYKLATALTYKF
jgi:hypothetical protein